MLFKANYQIFGEGYKVIEAQENLKGFNSLIELVNSDEYLKGYIIEELETEELTEDLLKNIEDHIFDYINSDEDVLQIVGYAESAEDFIRKHNLLTLQQVIEEWTEENTIYAFRNYQYSKNILLAKFEGFKNIGEVKQHCIDNDINLSEFNTATEEFTNVYFIAGENRKFDIEDLEAIYNSENIEVYVRGEVENCSQRKG